MNDALLRLYHHLPSSARSVAASLYGLYLRSWRYGAETGRLVEEAAEREHWSSDRWLDWREDRLAYVLDRAAKRVPFYREHWGARRRRGDRASWDLLENWPVLPKESVRANPKAFVADDCDVRRMYPDHTSGTSGSPLTVWLSKRTIRTWYALFEARARGWHGVSRRDRWGMLGGQLVTPFTQRRPPFWVRNAALNQLYVSSHHLAPDFIPACLGALRRYAITHILGYSSSLHTLAHESLARGEELPLRVAITNAEPLLDHQRDVVARAFGCPVRETYGMAELVAAASECSAGRLHVWPEVGWIEVRKEEGPMPPGEAGDFVCTSLLNADMPLIRYAVGDAGQLAPVETACPCGKTLQVMTGVEGRSTDLLLTRDRRRVFWLNPVFYGLPIREAQIVQESWDTLRVRYVPSVGFAPGHTRSLIERLQNRIGPVQVTLEEVEKIPREPNGKFRAVICDIPSRERELVCRA